MNTEENEMVQPYAGCDVCEAGEGTTCSSAGEGCCGCCQDGVPATTLQELKDAVAHLRELAERFPDRVLFHVMMETPDCVESANFGGSNLLEPESEGDLKHLRWMAARGYMQQSGAAMDGDPAAVGKGIEFLLARNDGKKRSGGSVLAAILSGIGEG